MDQAFQQQNQELPTEGTKPAALDKSDETTNVLDGKGAGPDSHIVSSPKTSTEGANAEGEKLPWKQRVLFEVKEVGLVIGYLATAFCIIQTFRCATILAKCSENDFLTSYLTACVSALVLGKFVFVLEKMHISKRFTNRPLIFAVVYKTALFTVLANLIMHAEAHLLHHDAPSAAANPTPALSDPMAFFLCAFAHQLALIVTFLSFFILRDISRVLGRGRLYKMFFVSIE